MTYGLASDGDGRLMAGLVPTSTFFFRIYD
jgi:hypothetical protein